MEYLGGIQGPENGEFGSLGPLDLGFGVNWDGIHHDFDGQHVNLLDGFFFGVQQSGVNGGMGGGMGGSGI